MRSRRVLAGLILSLTVLSGCLPETRIAWSPDGTHALVRAGDGLYLSDGDGKLSGRIAEDVPAVAWLPDSRRFIAACNQPAATWEELVPHLSEERKAAAEAEAEALRREVLAYKGDWGKFRFRTPSADILAALMCLRDRHGDELGPVVGDGWSGLKALRHGVYALRLFEVADGKVGEGKLLLESLEPPAEIRAAPTGKAFAYAAPPYPAQGAEAAFSLFVVPLGAPASATRVASRVSIFFDWAADGCSLVYASTDEPDPAALSRYATLGSPPESLVYRRVRMPEFFRQRDVRLGSLVRKAVVDGEGAVLAEPARTTLADVAFLDSMPVACLPDGRVLFAAREVRLPAAADGVAEDLALFAVEPSDPRTVRKLALPEPRAGAQRRLDLMQLSPDRTRLLIPDSKGAIDLLDLATGKTAEAAKDLPAVLSMTIPVWRSNRELCFIAETKDGEDAPKRQGVVLWSAEGTRCLSKDWAEAATKGFLAAGGG